MLPNSINIKNKNRFRKKGGVSYGSKKYSNPFFSKRKKTSKKKLVSETAIKRLRIISVAAITALAVSVWFLFYSNYFAINNIKADGGGRIPPETVEKLAWQQINDSFIVILPQKNIFFFSKNKLKKSLEEKYSFNSLDIQKKLPSTIIVKYDEKQYAMIWNEEDNYFYTDEKGYIITEVNLLEVKQKDYPIIKNNTDKKITDNNIPVGTEYTNYAMALFEKFKEYNNEFEIDKFIIDKEINTVKAAIIEGPQIYFDIRSEIDKQFNKLLVIKREKIKDSFYSKTYIDVRIGDSVYYR